MFIEVDFVILSFVNLYEMEGKENKKQFMKTGIIRKILVLALAGVLAVSGHPVLADQATDLQMGESMGYAIPGSADLAEAGEPSDDDLIPDTDIDQADSTDEEDRSDDDLMADTDDNSAKAEELPEDELATPEFTAPVTPLQAHRSGDAVTTNYLVTAFGGHEWVVIGDTSSGVSTGKPDQVTLFLKDQSAGGPPGFVKFNSSIDLSNYYQGSILQSEMNSAYSNLPVKEQRMVVLRDFDGGAFFGDGSDGVAGPGVKDAGFWPLSIAEAEKLDSSLWVFAGYWWSRSPAAYDWGVMAIKGRASDTGELEDGHYVTDECFMRPAFILNKSDVLFTTAAVNGKPSSVNEGLSAISPATGTIKLTAISSDDLALTVTSYEYNAEKNRLTVDYHGASTGQGKYVSCLLTDDSGNLLYYGKLSDLAASSLTIEVPDALSPGDYSLLLFNEEINDDYYTDFASIPEIIPLTIEPPYTPSSEKDVLSVTTPAGATIGQTTIMATVNQYDIVNQTIDLTVSSGASWKLYSDSSCLHEISDVTIELTLGSAAKAYVEVTAEDGSTKIYTLTIYKNGANLIVLAGSGGSVSGASSGVYGHGAPIIVTAEPSNGYHFTEWTVSGLNSLSKTANPAVFSMPSNRVTLTANFAKDKYTPDPPSPSTYSLTVTADSGGSVSGTESGNYAAGTAIRVAAEPSSSYHFTGWTVDGVTLSSPMANPAIFDMPSNTVALTANFKNNSGGGNNEGGGRGEDEANPENTVPPIIDSMEEPPPALSTDSITGLPSSYTMIVGTSVSWTPSPSGGVWSYNSDYFTMSETDGTVTFNAIKVGKTTAAYTVNGTEFVVIITINPAVLPQTGSSSLPLFVPLSLAITGLIVVPLVRRKHSHA